MQKNSDYSVENDVEDDENEENRYFKVLKEAEESGSPIKSHADFAEAYKKLFPERTIHQSTISHNFKKFNIEKNEDKEYVRNPKIEDKTIAVRHIFSDSCIKVSNINCIKVSGNKKSDNEKEDDANNKSIIKSFFKINTKAGYEHILCKAIEDCGISYYALIPCFCAVIVICNKQEKAKAIRKLVKEVIDYKKATEATEE